MSYCCIGMILCQWAEELHSVDRREKVGIAVVVVVVDKYSAEAGEVDKYFVVVVVVMIEAEVGKWMHQVGIGCCCCCYMNELQGDQGSSDTVVVVVGD